MTHYIIIHEGFKSIRGSDAKGLQHVTVHADSPGAAYGQIFGSLAPTLTHCPAKDLPFGGEFRNVVRVWDRDDDDQATIAYVIKIGD